MIMKMGNLDNFAKADLRYLSYSLSYISPSTVHHLLAFMFDNLNYQFKWLKMKHFWSTLCLLLGFGQNEGVKIGHLEPN